MKNFKIKEEKLQEIYLKTNKQIKKLLVKAFPTALLEFKKGVWYKSKAGTLFNWQPGWNVYGFNSDGTWCTSSNGQWFWTKIEGCTQATDEEVTTALRNEAKRRGYIEDCFEILDKNCKGFDVNVDNWAVYMYGATTLVYSKREGLGGSLMFENGNWAKQKDTKRINQIKKEIEDLQTELGQLEIYFK